MTTAPNFRVVVVDDEAAARRKLLRLLREDAGVQVVAEEDRGAAAVAAIDRYQPDLVFLDVQMPDMDGFAVLEAVAASARPQVVFVTAHDQYALRAFEVHAFDYLLKPCTADRFRDVLRRARDEHTRRDVDALAVRLHHLLEDVRRPPRYPDRLLIQENGRGVFVTVRSIAWIEAERNYVVLRCGGPTYMLRGTLDSLEAMLDPSLFVRINRSAIVCLDAVRELVPWFHGEYKVVLHDHTELRWTRRYVGQRADLLKLR
jgi:two-component system, LytTR family, response regulator